MSDPQRSLTTANPVAEDAPFRCEDCGQENTGHFCSQCGQARVAPPRTLLGVLGDFVGQYFNLEGKLWRTLTLLVTKPGVLTREYFAGRRTRYFTPVRLYLTLSLLFFTLSSFTSPKGALEVRYDEDEKRARAEALAEAKRDVAEAQASLREAGRDPVALEVAREVLIEAEETLHEAEVEHSAASKPAPARRRLDLWWLPGADAALDKLLMKVKTEDHAKLQRHFRDALMAQSPRVLFLLLPLFALFFKWVFRRRCFYTEAFVFTLHLHSVVFIAVLLSSLLGLSGLLGLATIAHSLLAMKRVFGQGWAKTIAKAGLVLICYSVTLTGVGGWLAYRIVVDL